MSRSDRFANENSNFPMSFHKNVTADFSHKVPFMVEIPAFKSALKLNRLRAALEPAPAGRVLDPACGPGIISGVIAPVTLQFVGVDIISRMVKLARRRLTE